MLIFMITFSIFTPLCANFKEENKDLRLYEYELESCQF